MHVNPNAKDWKLQATYNRQWFSAAKSGLFVQRLTERKSCARSSCAWPSAQFLPVMVFAKEQKPRQPKNVSYAGLCEIAEIRNKYAFYTISFWY
jgi:hypothetical protein